MEEYRHEQAQRYGFNDMTKVQVSAYRPWLNEDTTPAQVIADPLDALLKHPWFTRVWVVQEASLAKKLFVQCGIVTMPWDDFLAAVYFFEPGSLGASTHAERGYWSRALLGNRFSAITVLFRKSRSYS